MMSSQSSSLALLSICIPAYNHADRLRLQFESLAGFADEKSKIEFVIVDDASTDDIDSVIRDYRSAGWLVKSIRQSQNHGRAAALARAINMATGRYVMLMDADDVFLPTALERVLNDIEDMDKTEEEYKVGLVYGVEIFDDKGVTLNIPPGGCLASLLSIRADYRVKGDLKEVIKREVIKSALCPLFDQYRRVPTSLLWARISERCKVESKPYAILQKVYLEGGMTKNINIYRANSTEPLLELYGLIADSTTYSSITYRLKALINYHRFLVWAKESEYRVRLDMVGLPAIIGTLYGYAEYLLGRSK